MFEKTSRLAEKLAISVSRRGFLDSVGRWAGATALAMAGVLTAPTSVQAGPPQYNCCKYCFITGNPYWACVKGPCPTYGPGPSVGYLCGSFATTRDCQGCPPA